MIDERDLLEIAEHGQVSLGVPGEQRHLDGLARDPEHDDSDREGEWMRDNDRHALADEIGARLL